MNLSLQTTGPRVLQVQEPVWLDLKGKSTEKGGLEGEKLNTAMIQDIPSIIDGGRGQRRTEATNLKHSDGHV